MSFKFKLDRSLPAKEKISQLRRITHAALDDLAIGDSVEVIFNHLELGRGIVIEDGAKLVCDRGVIGDFTFIGGASDIRAGHLFLDTGVKLGHNMRVLAADQLRIGRNGFIGYSCELVCRSADIGEGFYGEHDLTIGGGGGSTGPFSELKIGRFVHIGEFSVLNTARSVTIGDEAGLGAYVMLYTHGMWPPALEGYPLAFGSISIGPKCWITGQSIVLPGVTIGEGAVVAMGSVVNRDLPARCLAGGRPATVLKQNMYGHKLSAQEEDDILRDILNRYVAELEFKGFAVQKFESGENVLLEMDEAVVGYFRSKADLHKLLSLNKRTIVIAWNHILPDLSESSQITLFNLGEMKVEGCVDDISEDLRDFLRRNCIRFYTRDRFHSIRPPSFSRLMES